MRRTTLAMANTMIVMALIWATALALPAGAATPPTDPHEVGAEQEADTVVGGYPAPTAWQEVSTAPTPDLVTLHEGIGPGIPAQRTRFWIAPADIATVNRLVSIAPPDFTGDAFDTSPSGITVSFEGPLTPAWSAFLLVTTAPIDSGHTGVRIDAEVIWYPTRQADELAPAGVTSATLTAWVAGTHRVMSRRTFTDPATIRKLAYQFDALPVEPIGGAISCPAPLPLRIGLRLNGPRSRRIVANAGSACGLVEVATAGRNLPLLAGVRTTGGPGLEDVEAATLKTTTSALEAVALALDRGTR